MTTESEIAAIRSGIAAPGFDAQVDRFLQSAWTGVAGLSETAIRVRLERLRVLFERTLADGGSAGGPFIVLSDTLAPLRDRVARIDRADGRPGTVIGPTEVGEYRTIESLGIPGGDAYLLVGVDLGDETRNVPPAVALRDIGAMGRTPLTIAEGLAVHAQCPDVIDRDRGFSLAGSTRGDRRVPALWVSKGRPKLGWCYLGAPHTWLGTASCLERIGA